MLHRIGPLIATRIIMPIFNNVRVGYWINAIMLFYSWLKIYFQLDETLEDSKKKPMNWAACNPVNFISVMSRSWEMSKLFWISCLQSFIDGRNIVESNMVYQRETLGFTEEENGNYVALAGFKIYLGGLLGRPLIKYFGLSGMTTFSNFANLIAQGWGLLASTPLMMYIHVLLTGLGERKRDGVETMINRLGAEMDIVS